MDDFDGGHVSRTAVVNLGDPDELDEGPFVQSKGADVQVVQPRAGSVRRPLDQLYRSHGLVDLRKLILGVDNGPDGSEDPHEDVSGEAMFIVVANPGQQRPWLN